MEGLGGNPLPARPLTPGLAPMGLTFSASPSPGARGEAPGKQWFPAEGHLRQQSDCPQARARGRGLFPHRVNRAGSRPVSVELPGRGARSPGQAWNRLRAPCLAGAVGSLGLGIRLAFRLDGRHPPWPDESNGLGRHKRLVPHVFKTDGRARPNYSKANNGPGRFFLETSPIESRKKRRARGRIVPGPAGAFQNIFPSHFEDGKTSL
jgi:hypothetical protein